VCGRVFGVGEFKYVKKIKEAKKVAIATKFRQKILKYTDFCSVCDMITIFMYMIAF